ncbi:hypothetical protein BKA66DRAFT_419912 [Pyrenochaeta sp. MPI-SDFR-AT-0127]|nr:hypothetical protein BKA66DRAFT_419912 [Pyrenochaeta sp. MPI-SDFR-AT-0127]
MLAKSIFAVAFLALAQFAVAAPPGCLLGAVNTYSDPANVQAVCKEKDVSSKVATFCGDDAEAALEALADICNEKGVKVATDVPTSTSASSKPSGTGSLSPTGNDSASGNSTVPTATGGPRVSGSAGGASGTSTGGPAQSTGAASSVEIGVAAVLAGLMAVAL